jgi:OOP family OmpA-OmpF porin
MRFMKWAIVGLSAVSFAGSGAAQIFGEDDSSIPDAWLDGGSWYVGGKFGGNWALDTRFRSENFAAPINGKARYEDGFIGALQAGYELDGGVRFELEFADRYNQVDRVSPYGQGRGSLRNYAVMLNGIYDVPIGFEITPYIGLGVGGAYYNPDHVRGDGFPYPAYYSGSSWGIAVQAMAGLAYKIDDNVTVTLEYRYMNRPNDYSEGIHSDYESHSALIGFRYYFGERAYPQPPTQAYVPPPVVPAAPRNYLVFFDFNKSDLTPEARTIVDRASENAKTAAVTRLEVTGYTDTVGSDAYNMRLSRRRAESVAAELEKSGVSASEIAIFAKGKHDLLVPTADGVREPQNRRVQIVFPGSGAPNS